MIFRADIDVDLPPDRRYFRKLPETELKTVLRVDQFLNTVTNWLTSLKIGLPFVSYTAHVKERKKYGF